MAVAAATDWREVLALRFLSGLGLGSVWGIAAAHVNETGRRTSARATSFVLSSFSIGAAIAAAAASYLLPAHGWRALFFVCGAAVVIAMVYVWRYVPESETWLADRQRSAPARRKRGRARRRSLFAPALLRVTLLGTLVSALTLAAYWAPAPGCRPSAKERGLETGTMARFLVLLNIGMFVGYNAFGYIADAASTWDAASPPSRRCWARCPPPSASTPRRRVHDRRRRGAAAARRQDCRRRRTRRRWPGRSHTPQHKQEFRHDAPLRRSVHLPGERCRLRSARLQARDPVLHPRTHDQPDRALLPRPEEGRPADGEGWAVEKVTLSTHNGTHLDAPFHFHSTMDKALGEKNPPGPSTKCRWNGVSSPA